MVHHQEEVMQEHHHFYLEDQTLKKAIEVVQGKSIQILQYQMLDEAGLFIIT